MIELEMLLECRVPVEAGTNVPDLEWFQTLYRTSFVSLAWVAKNLASAGDACDDAPTLFSVQINGFFLHAEMALPNASILPVPT
jgi:hypothetical protein